MKNRYLVTKNIFEDYLILIKQNQQYVSYDIDKMIINKLNIKKIKDLKYLKINYLILDNLQIIEKEAYQDNTYNDYYLKIKLLNIIERIYNK